MLPKARNRKFLTFCLGIGLMLPTLMALTPASARGQDEKTKGKWGKVFDFQNVAIHTHVLPNGKVLYWGRREKGQDINKATDCLPFIWDPEKENDGPAAFEKQAQPLNNHGGKYNLFCSGHTFLADGRLLVVGGHISDNHGEPHAVIYDLNKPVKDRWTPIEDMPKGPHMEGGGRWYPTAVTLPDGSVLVSSGSNETGDNNQVQIIRKIGANEKWRSIVGFVGLPLYPRMHVAQDGRVLMTGLIKGDAVNPRPNQFEGSYLLDPTKGGAWTDLKAPQQAPQRDYFPSVIYDVGKVLIVGGGLPPQKTAEIINLKDANPTWQPTEDMSIGRRHHNATILPDGTVLVTGGTSGNDNNGPNKFNDQAKPVLQAELWDPKGNNGKGKWTALASESVARIYHSTAVLLPDGRVLSAGGGEYVINKKENDAKFSHRDAQIFSPPYLCTGAARPVINKVKSNVTYKEVFSVETTDPVDDKMTVTWIRLSSVTHAFNQNQRINLLASTPSKMKGEEKKLIVTAPLDGNACPPGHYMLFVLNKDNIPSVARIIQIQ